MPGSRLAFAVRVEMERRWWVRMVRAQVCMGFCGKDKAEALAYLRRSPMLERLD